MSAEFLYCFFPEATKLVKEQLPLLLHRIFPGDVQQQCPPHSVQIYDLTIRWPWLMPVAVVGVLLGLVGCATLATAQLELGWSRSMLFFALMNLAAIPTHCLLTLDLDSTGYLIARALDAGATGASCLAAMHAALQAIFHTLPAQQAMLSSAKEPRDYINPGPEHSQGSPPRRTTALLLGVGSTLMMTAAVAGNLAQVPWTTEAMYLGPLLLCVPAVGAYLVAAARAPWATRGTRAWSWLAVAGMLLAVSGLPLDRHLCAYLGSAAVTHCHVLFLGCDIIFSGLLGHLMARQNSVKLRASSSTGGGGSGGSSGEANGVDKVKCA